MTASQLTTKPEAKDTFEKITVKAVDPRAKFTPTATVSGEKRSIWAFITLSWLDPLLKRGFREPLLETHLPALQAHERSEAAATVLDPFWSKLRLHQGDPSKPRPSLAAPFARKYWKLFLASIVLQAINVAINIVLPTQIANVIDALSSSERYITTAFVYAAVFFGLSVLNGLSLYTYRSLDIVVTIGVRAIAIAGVYRKSLIISPRSRVKFSAGNINSLIDVDIPACQDFAANLFNLLAGVVQVVLALYFIARLLGVTTYITVGIFVVLAGCMGGIVPFYSSAQQAYMQRLDSRTRTLREFLYGIQSIKYKGLENHHIEAINTIRSAQLKALRGILWSFGMIICVILLQGSSLPVITIIGYSKLGGTMDASNIFPILALLGALVAPTANLPSDLQGVVSFFVSYRRLSNFMFAEEVVPSQVTVHNSDPAEVAVMLKNAHFTYGLDDSESESKAFENGDAIDPASQRPFSLKDMNLSISKGSLVGIVGSVGSGKSTLLSALLGEVRKVSGEAVVNGSIAYCSQDPYIMSGSIAQNILGLFNGKGSSDRLTEAIDACCLTKDLEGFPMGAGQRIGEKGATLSGGQRARVALARAWAADADLVLLDDPLSALDSKVGAKVFEETICRGMKNKTVLMVTHQLQLLSKVDLVIVMESGTIAEVDSFAALRDRPDSRLSILMEHYCREDESNAVAKAKSVREVQLELEDKIVIEEREVEEDRREGQVAGRYFLLYFTAIGAWFPYVMALAILIYIGWSAATSILLVVWTGNLWGWTLGQYFNLYVIFGMVTALVSMPQIALILVCSYRAATRLHDGALNGLANAPMSWYQEQPVGRILNRMTTDVSNLDTEMMQVVLSWLGSLSSFAVSVIITFYASYYMTLVLLVLAVPALLFFQYYARSYREVKRLLSTMRSPLNSHLSETLNGQSTVKAYGAQKRFMEQLHRCMNMTNTSTMLLNSINFWLGLRLDTLASVVTFMLLILAGCRVVPPAAIGLGLVATIQMGQTLNDLLRNIGTLEASFNSVERLDYYMKSLPLEPPRILPSDPPAGDGWPTAGAIEIRNLEVRYKGNSMPVLKDLSLSVAPGEKVAVVGRSGAGKSTLMAALFRMMDFSGGSIHIDGRDISAMGVHALRQRLHIITQEPILFQGSLRSNLDPLSRRTDAEIWDALEIAGLKDHVSELQGKLDFEIDEGGKNLSAGQRALTCLATTLLEKPTVLVMDEATASIDSLADARIQQCMREQFARSTVFAIAHRLNTIAAFDRVLVMRDGERVEFDAPHVLLQKEDSEFTALVRATGAMNAAMIADVARVAYLEKHSAA